MGFSHRCPRLAVFALLLLFLGQTAAFSGPPFVYVANAEADSVSVIDPSTNSVVTTIPVGDQPLAVAVAPDGARVYVAHLAGDVSVIDVVSNSVIATISLSTTLADVVVAPDASRVYVSAGSSVFAIDAATNAVVASISVNGGGMAISPDGARLYVANGTDVVAIDTGTNTVQATIPVGDTPQDAALTPNGSRLYVSNAVSNSLSVVATATNQVVATIPLGSPANPIGIAVTPDGSRAYVANNNGGAVAVIDTTANTVVTTIPVLNPAYVAIAPDGTRVYVTRPDDDLVAVIDATTNTLLTSVTVGQFPVGIATRTLATCSSGVVTLAALRAEVDALHTSARTKATLVRALENVESALGLGNNKAARTRLVAFIDKVVERSNLGATNPDRIPMLEANHLVCGAANVLGGIVVP